MHLATHQAIAAVWRIDAERIVAVVARTVRDVGVAEELAQDALVAAPEHWPREGIPDTPGAWLMTTAKRRALDHLRLRKLREGKLAELEQDLEALVVPDFVDALDAARQDDIGDDLLLLIFTACHPILSAAAAGGLTTHEIARAFLLPVPTIAQRIVRDRRTLAEARVPYEVPRGAEGCYALQAAIAACHARAPSGAETDWARIAALYARLGEVAPWPVVELNRAVAVALAEGPAAALSIVAAGGSSRRGHTAGACLWGAGRSDMMPRHGRLDVEGKTYMSAPRPPQAARPFPWPRGGPGP